MSVFFILNVMLNVNVVQNLYPPKCTLLVTSLKEVVFNSICLFVCAQDYRKATTKWSSMKLVEGDLMSAWRTPWAFL